VCDVDLVEGSTENLCQFLRIIGGPEMHEEEPRLIVQHVIMQGGYLDAVRARARNTG
jgi:hypothetical protein